MSRRRDRAVVVSLAGVVIAGALVSVALQSGWLWYVHYWRLKSDPSRLETTLLDDDEAKQTAVERFVHTGPGKQALLRLYLEEFRRAVSDPVWNRLVKLTGSRANHGMLAMWPNGYCQVLFAKKRCRSSFTSAFTEPSKFRARLLTLIDSCVDFPVRFDDLPRFEFIVKRAGKEDLYTPDWSGDGKDVVKIAIRDPKARHFCFFRILPE